ncbi:MAG TPA: hypothetical protein VE890_00075 [Thermoguttaceae bacterium]|nr:hypothetical protein [Thermoguttaceae bacterium]
MSQGLVTPTQEFVDRRDYSTQEQSPISERRQFTSTHDNLSPDAQELAQAIDQYKVRHRRRFITYEEMITVVKSLGYRR